MKYWNSLVMTAIAVGGTTTILAADHTDTQMREMYQIQSAFHRFGSVADPVNGDSAAAIDQRIRDMLTLWTSDGYLSFAIGGARDGDYIGTGDPGDPSTCPAPSVNPGNRGTLCTFFKYVAAAFQPANKLISLAPSYKTHFDVLGATATIYFECHFFNVAMDSASATPPWTAASHLTFDGTTRRADSGWLFAHGRIGLAPVPLP